VSGVQALHAISRRPGPRASKRTLSRSKVSVKLAVRITMRNARLQPITAIASRLLRPPSNLSAEKVLALMAVDVGPLAGRTR
jgi:hypothetical protein